MKRLLFLLVVMLLFSQLVADTQSMQRLAVRAGARYLDQLCMDTLHLLEQVAESPAAKAGDWDGISWKLQELSYRLPGVYFYVLPNGNYYTVDKGYTNLNLSDRGYFESLFQGNPVLGYEIYSRSSGKKSGLMAAPIFDREQVSGALGASIFLDELHSKINRELMVPLDYTWFVISSDGLTMLDQDQDYIFINALTQTPEPMQNAISTALRSSSGSIAYKLGNTTRTGFYQKLANLDWWMFLVKKEGQESQDQIDLSLKVFGSELQAAWDKLDANMLRIMREIKTDFSSEEGIRTLMSEMLQGNPAIVEIAYVDLAGKMRYIEPKEYKNFEGTEISDQAHVTTLHKTKKAVFSNAFPSVEGFQAVSLAYPAFDRKGKLAGSISLLINPVFMVEPLLKNVNIPYSHELWIMQTDGLIVYDLDWPEIGKNLFKDPHYQGFDSLLKLGKEIAAKKSGSGDYVFEAVGDTEKVLKQASWDTIRLYGVEWRVVISEEL
jgi:hypothetical protein